MNPPAHEHANTANLRIRRTRPLIAPAILEEDIPLLESDPAKVRGTHYDVVMNGLELGSGSLRNHRADVQRKILTAMGYSDEEMEQIELDDATKPNVAPGTRKLKSQRGSPGTCANDGDRS